MKGRQKFKTFYLHNENVCYTFAVHGFYNKIYTIFSRIEMFLRRRMGRNLNNTTTSHFNVNT